VRVALALAGLHLLRRAGALAVNRGARLWQVLALALAVPAAVTSGWGLAGLVADEIIWRGVLQGSLERRLGQSRAGDETFDERARRVRVRLLAALLTLALQAAALVLAGSASGAALTAMAVATAARAVSGRLSGAVAARFGLTLTRLAMAVFS